MLRPEGSLCFGMFREIEVRVTYGIVEPSTFIVAHIELLSPSGHTRVSVRRFFPATYAEALVG